MLEMREEKNRENEERVTTLLETYVSFVNLKFCNVIEIV